MNSARVLLLLSFALMAPTATRAQSEQPPPTVVLRGVIRTYDAASRILTVAVEKSTEQFEIGNGVRVSERWQAIAATSLADLTGRRVAVRYVVSHDVKQVESVHVFGRSEERR